MKKVVSLFLLISVIVVFNSGIMVKANPQVEVFIDGAENLKYLQVMIRLKSLLISTLIS